MSNLEMAYFPSRRDVFAAAALAGLLAGSPDMKVDLDTLTNNGIIESAVRHADAMIVMLDQK